MSPPGADRDRAGRDRADRDRAGRDRFIPVGHAAMAAGVHPDPDGQLGRHVQHQFTVGDQPLGQGPPCALASIHRPTALVPPPGEARQLHAASVIWDSASVAVNSLAPESSMESLAAPSAASAVTRLRRQCRLPLHRISQYFSRTGAFFYVDERFHLLLGKMTWVRISPP